MRQWFGIGIAAAILAAGTPALAAAPPARAAQVKVEKHERVVEKRDSKVVTDNAAPRARVAVHRAHRRPVHRTVHRVRAHRRHRVVGTSGRLSAMRFRGMDRNRDGVIERSEWRGSETSFEQHDWNHDGRLSGDELRPGAPRPTGR